MYLDMNGNEVLTNIRWFEGEDSHSSPLYLRTNEFGHLTAMDYVGKPVPGNTNVIQMDGEWVELERYGKKEIKGMLIDPTDDLALTEKDLAHLNSNFSYEYSLYFANAQGKNPLDECMAQFQKMDAFDNSWYYVVKLWQAPNEYVTVHNLRQFRSTLKKTEQLGNLVIAVGHDEKLNPGEIRMMLLTYYNERCCPTAEFEDDWERKCRNLSIKELMEAVPELRQTIDDLVYEKYKEEVFLDQM